jgi:hypothetical protein
MSSLNQILFLKRVSMKYKIYKLAEKFELQNQFSLSVNHKLCIFLNQPLDAEETLSLGKLSQALGFTSEQDIYIYNNANPNWFSHHSEISSSSLLEQLWVFGLTPTDFGFPVSTPLGRGFICLGKVWMFFPSYSTIIKNEKTKRDLWNALKNVTAIL